MKRTALFLVLLCFASLVFADTCSDDCRCLIAPKDDAVYVPLYDYEIPLVQYPLGEGVALTPGVTEIPHPYSHPSTASKGTPIFGGSLLWSPGDTASAGWAEPHDSPSLDVKTHATTGIAAGGGYRFSQGWELLGQVIYTRQDVDARWVVPDFEGAILQRHGERSKVGLAITFIVPLK